MFNDFYETTWTRHALMYRIQRIMDTLEESTGITLWEKDANFLCDFFKETYNPEYYKDKIVNRLTGDIDEDIALSYNLADAWEIFLVTKVASKKNWKYYQDAIEEERKHMLEIANVMAKTRRIEKMPRDMKEEMHKFLEFAYNQISMREARSLTVQYQEDQNYDQQFFGVL